LDKNLEKFVKQKKQNSFREYGIVVSIQDGIAVVTGLKNAGISETVAFTSGITGMVSTLERDITRICLMGPDSSVKPGDLVYTLKKFIEVPTGTALLGRVVDSLGNPIDGKGPLVQKTLSNRYAALSEFLTKIIKAKKYKKRSKKHF